MPIEIVDHSEAISWTAANHLERTLLSELREHNTRGEWFCFDDDPSLVTALRYILQKVKDTLDGKFTVPRME